MGQSGRIASVVHDFRDRLEYSCALSDEPSWVSFYQRIWPEAISILRIDAHSEWQRWGVDRLVFLPNGRQLLIDEKKREPRADGKVFDDLLLEEWSVFHGEGNSRNKIGWTLDANKRCDFIAYAIVQLKKCYLLPFELLRLAFEVNRSEWLRSYRVIDVKNSGYLTRNVPVPWAVVKTAINEQMHRKFGAGDLKLPGVTMIADNQIAFHWADEEAR